MKCSGVAPFSGVLLLCLLVSGGVCAQETPGDGEGVNSQILWITPGPSQYISVQSSDILAHRDAAFGVMSQYYRHPLGLKIDGEEYWSVKRVTSLDFSWAVGIADHFQLGMVLPVVLEQYGKGAEPLFPDDPEAGKYEVSSAAIGDLRFHGKTRFFGGNAEDPDTRGFGVAVDVAFSVPSGDELNYAGENGVVFAPTAIFDFQQRHVSAALDAGVRLRSGEIAELAYTTVGNQFSSGIGVTVRLFEKLFLLSVESNLLAELDDFSRMGMEIRGAVGVSPDDARSVTLWLSGGAGFASSEDPLLSVPQMRFLLGLAYSPSFGEI